MWILIKVYYIYKKLYLVSIWRETKLNKIKKNWNWIKYKILTCDTNIDLTCDIDTAMWYDVDLTCE